MGSSTTSQWSSILQKLCYSQQVFLRVTHKQSSFTNVRQDAFTIRSHVTYVHNTKWGRKIMNGKKMDQENKKCSATYLCLGGPSRPISWTWTYRYSIPASHGSGSGMGKGEYFIRFGKECINPRQAVRERERTSSLIDSVVAGCV